MTSNGSSMNNTNNINNTNTNKNIVSTSDDVPIVYFTKNITPEALQKIYDATGFKATGKVGVKISTGESERSNYLRPELIGDFIRGLNGTIVEANTAYGGSRSNSDSHLAEVAKRGFNDIGPFDLLDQYGTMDIPVTNGKRLTRDIVGDHFANYDSFILLQHFKGHAMAGYGGAIKNMSIGFASGMEQSESGKILIHSGGKQSSGSIFGSDQEAFLEAMAEASKGVADYMAKKGGIVYINVLNRLSVDCDCDANPAEPDMHDIGIMASLDPVALDQASIDMVYCATDSSKSLRERIESRNGFHTLEHAEEIGHGSRKYTLVDIDTQETIGKSAVIYFSATGTTRAVAEEVSRQLNAQNKLNALIEITPSTAYTSADLNWNDNSSRVSQEHRDASVRPDIKNNLSTVMNCDEIYIGYPLWWGMAPNIISSFIEKYNLEGKKIYLFCTSSSSGPTTSINTLKSRYPNLNFVDVRRFSRGSTSEIGNWLRNL